MCDVIKTPKEVRRINPDAPEFDRAASDHVFERNLNAAIEPGNSNMV